jgi:hypothetical protein
MTRNPVTVTLDMPIIVDEERVVGVVTESDLFGLIVTIYQIEQCAGR